MLPRLTAIASSKSGSQQAVFCASSPPLFCQQGRSFFLYPSSPTGVRQGVHKSSLSATERSAQARRDASPALSSSSAVSFSRQLGNSSQGSSMVQGALLCQRQTHAGTSDRADQAEARDAADAGTGSKQHSSPRVEQASVCMEDQTYTTVAVPVFVMLPLDTVSSKAHTAKTAQHGGGQTTLRSKHSLKVDLAWTAVATVMVSHSATSHQGLSCFSTLLLGLGCTPVHAPWPWQSAARSCLTVCPSAARSSSFHTAGVAVTARLTSLAGECRRSVPVRVVPLVHPIPSEAGRHRH